MTTTTNRLIWATDLHLENASPEAIDAFLASLREANADTLVLTGDIATARTLETWLARIHESFPGDTYFVLGNHDFYGSGTVAVRESVTRFCAILERAHYLSDGGAISLSSETALVGVDGWGDARYGNWSGTDVSINDFGMIDDLKWSVMARSLFTETLRSLGDDSAARLRKQIEQAVASHKNIVVATHVPPFWEAAWLPEGESCEVDWVPYFACKAVGDVLLEAADANPECNFTVLCGHTHGSGEVSMRPNLHITTGGATYGVPRLQEEIVIDQHQKPERARAARRL